MVKKYFFVVILLTGGMAYARGKGSLPQNIETPFDVNEVIEKVSDYQTSESGEFLIDTSVVFLSAPYDQQYPATAFDGTNYFVVWSGGWGYIYGSRVSQSGTVLDPAGIVISTAGNYQSFPSVAFDGTNYLVVWQKKRSGSDFSDIYGARVSKSGMVIDSEGIAISTAESNQERPSIGFDGTNYLVVWQDWRSGAFDIYGSRVNKSGTVLDPDGIAISTGPLAQLTPAVVFDGTNYLVVWTDGRSGSDDIYGARLNKSGTVLDTAGIAISTAAGYQTTPSVAFDGTNCLVVWTRDMVEIYGARLSQSGTVLDPAGIVISTAAHDRMYPSVAFDGTNYLVVWQDWRSWDLDSADTFGARVSKAGMVLDPAGIAISAGVNMEQSPAVAFGGTNYLVVWMDGRSGSEDIFGARLNRSGSVLDPEGIVISTAADYQEYPSAAFDGTNNLVVWQNRRSGSDSSDIYGARVSPSGVVLDPAGFAISTAEFDQSFPAVAFDGANYLVVWVDRRNDRYGDIYGTKVSKSGIVLDPAGIPISTVVFLTDLDIWKWQFIH